MNVIHESGITHRFSVGYNVIVTFFFTRIQIIIIEIRSIVRYGNWQLLESNNGETN